MTLQDILDLVNFYIGKFSSDTSTEQSKKIQAINTAKDIIITQLGLPSSEKTFTFTFTDDKEKYELPDDFLEPISLSYDESFSSLSSSLNQKVLFEYVYPEELISSGKYAGIVYWGIDYSESKKRLYIKAKNSSSGFILDNCEDTSVWSGSNDADELSVDSIRYASGSGSLKFKIDETISGNERATLTFTPTSAQDLSSYIGVGSFYMQMYMDDPTGVSSVTLSWKEDASNYWYVTVTTNADGDSFQADSWNELVFDWTDAQQVGSPDASNITSFQIDIDYSEATFVSPQYWNIDLFKIMVMDRFILRYYSQNVVQSSGGTYKKDFENTTDVATFASVDASIGNLVAQLAASIYNPTVNKDFGGNTSFITSLFQQILPEYKLRFPKRTPIYYRGKFVNPKLRYQ